MIGFFIKGNVIRIWANSTTRLHFPPFAMFESPLISFQYHISSGKQTANKRWSALSQKLMHPSNRLLRNYPIHSRLFHSCIAGSLFPRSSVLFDGDICQLQTSTNKLFKDSNVSISNLQKSGFLFPILRNPVFPSCTNFPISGFRLIFTPLSKKSYSRLPHTKINPRWSLQFGYTVDLFMVSS